MGLRLQRDIRAGREVCGDSKCPLASVSLKTISFVEPLYTLKTIIWL